MTENKLKTTIHEHEFQSHFNFLSKYLFKFSIDVYTSQIVYLNFNIIIVFHCIFYQKM